MSDLWLIFKGSVYALGILWVLKVLFCFIESLLNRRSFHQKYPRVCARNVSNRDHSKHKPRTMESRLGELDREWGKFSRELKGAEHR